MSQESEKLNSGILPIFSLVCAFVSLQAAYVRSILILGIFNPNKTNVSIFCPSLVSGVMQTSGQTDTHSDMTERKRGRHTMVLGTSGGVVLTCDSQVSEDEQATTAEADRIQWCSNAGQREEVTGGLTHSQCHCASKHTLHYCSSRKGNTHYSLAFNNSSFSVFLWTLKRQTYSSWDCGRDQVEKQHVCVLPIGDSFMFSAAQLTSCLDFACACAIKLIFS